MAVVSLKDLHKSYPLGKESVEAVKGVSFEIEKGEFAAISGPSGSGKSTLVNEVLYKSIARELYESKE